MGSLSKFVTGLSIAVIAGMAVNMGVAVAEPPPSIPGSPLMAGMKMEKISAEPIDPDQVDPAMFLADLFGDHFGVRYVPGSSGLSTTLAGATVDGQEIPADLIADYEASGFEVLRRWNVQVVSGGGVVGEASFTETSRTAMPGLSPSSEQLHMHGIASSSRAVVSGYVRNARGEERELFGLVAETRLNNGTGLAAFTPLGGASDEAGAADRAGELAQGLDVQVQQVVPPANPGPVPPGGGANACRQRCLNDWRVCMNAAQNRYQACIMNATAATTICVAGILTACISAGPFYPACAAAAGAACLAAEALMLEACRRSFEADKAICDNAYNNCIAQCR